MKRLAFVLPFLLVSFTLAHPGHEDKKQPTVDDYETALQEYSVWSGSIDSEVFYKDVEFTRKPKKEGDEPVKVKFADLKPFEKNLFYLYQAEVVSNHLALLRAEWKTELVKLEKAVEPTPKEGEGDAVEEAGVATIKDVKEYLEKLHGLRKEHAVRYESLAERIFKEFADEIPQKDRENYATQMRKWHDDQNLIDRKE